MPKPQGHEIWESIEDVVVINRTIWTGYLKVQGGWLVKSIFIDHNDEGGAGGVPKAMGLTFVPDPGHNHPPTYVE